MGRSKRLLIYYSTQGVNMYNFMLVVMLIIGGCARDYPAVVGPKAAVITATSSTTACSCTTGPGSCTSTPASTTTSPPVQGLSFDTLKVPPPHFFPDGGTFHMSTQVRLTADTLPVGAVIDYSVDNGKNWITGQQFTLNSGGTILTRIRVGNKRSINRSAVFNLYFERMLVIGNSIMSHGPAPDLGWFNNNGMAASAPEKDFIHLLTGQLQTLYSGLAVKLQSSGGIERQYGMANYSIDEFNDPVLQFKPDLILVRMGENVDDSQVQARNFEAYFREFLERLTGLSGSQPVKIVCTTSVWSNPQADAVIRKVTNEKGHVLVDLSCMVGQGQYFASQYANGAVAAHPNDAGMQRIDELIWEKIR